MSRIAESLTPHRERQHQFEIVASLHRSEATLAFVTTVRLATVMLMPAVVRNVLAGRVGIIMVMVPVVVSTMILRVLNYGSQPM